MYSIILILFLVFTHESKLQTAVYDYCDTSHMEKLKFSLVKRCQRSQQNIIELENTQSLEDCIALAKRVRGLALNYAPATRRQKENKFENITAESQYTYHLKRNRQHFWQQPQEFFNCHILECPENATFHTMSNDSRFDYFSLYGNPIVSLNYTCIPEVGLFELHSTPQTFTNASNICEHSLDHDDDDVLLGKLAHIASESRTNALASILNKYNEQRNADRHIKPLYMAYVGLYANSSKIMEPTFQNFDNESLNCFLYSAWGPGYPKKGDRLANTSCVAITAQRFWMNVDCERQLPFICEIYTSQMDNKEREMGLTLSDEC